MLCFRSNNIIASVATDLSINKHQAIDYTICGGRWNTLYDYVKHFIRFLALKAAKTDRRTAKATLTRCGKSSAKLIEAKRPEQEVRDGLSKLQLAFDTLVEKHEYYSRLLEDDSEFEVQEGWMGKCQEDFMSIEMDAKMYLDSFLSKGKTPLKNRSAMRTWGLMLSFIPFGWNDVLKYQYLGVELLQVRG